MKRKKMSLANIKDKLSRAEMKKILAGSETVCFFLPMFWCMNGIDCMFADGGYGKCRSNTEGTHCYCAGAS